MIQRIQTKKELGSIADLSNDWKIAAVRAWDGWSWCGSLSIIDAREITDAIFASAGPAPKISCVTGRNEEGNVILYARLYPSHLKDVRPKW